jgi:DNA-binding NarL/FixJ family response regulator
MLAVSHNHSGKRAAVNAGRPTGKLEKAAETKYDLDSQDNDSKVVRVLLVDDHPIVREGIRNLLAEDKDIDVVGEAVNGANALDMVKKLSPDVIILDLQLPDIHGTEVVKHLKEAGQASRILILSAYDDQEYINALIGLGVSGYVVKDDSPFFLIDAVNGVARGENGWVSRKIAAKMVARVMDDPHTQSGLTKREMQILARVVQGKTNQEIAYDLEVTEKTVEKHLFSIFTKLGISSRVEAAIYAVRKGWF